MTFESFIINARKLLLVFGICGHVWQLKKETPIFDGDSGSRPVGTKYISSCIHCGNVKVRKIWND